MRENLDPKQWGPCAWNFMENCAKGCDGVSMAAYEEFVRLIPDLLPCEACRNHASEYIKMHPVIRSDPAAWVRAFREHVAAAVARRRVPEPEAFSCPVGINALTSVTLWVMFVSAVAIVAWISLSRTKPRLSA